MFALVAAVGTPAFQLPAVNQSEETAPVQSVWAYVETVDVVKSAIVASNLEETNVQPARASAAAFRRESIDDRQRGSRPISRLPSMGNRQCQTIKKAGPPEPQMPERREGITHKLSVRIIMSATIVVATVAMVGETLFSDC